MRTIVDWKVVGPQALAWMRAELPRRSTIVGIYEDCHAAIPAVHSADGLRLYLSRQAAAEWRPIKRTLGAGNGAGNDGTAPTPAAGAVGSLRDFVREERLAADRAACPVCRLPESIRRELADDGVTRALKIRYVQVKYGTLLTLANLDGHARHQ